MFGNATALGGLHMTGKYRDKNMLHTRSRHAAWDPHRQVGHGNDENWSVWKVLIRGRSWERTAVSHQVMRPPNSLFLSSLDGSPRHSRPESGLNLNIVLRPQGVDGEDTSSRFEGSSPAGSWLLKGS